MKFVRLTEFINGRDNNFNIIRVAAALLVLITHSFALVTGSGDAEPLRATLGMTLGAVAVDIFFVSSGFLVTASLLRTKDLFEFSLARILRIYPALIVMLLLSVFLLGPYFTDLRASDYFTQSIVYTYFVKCGTLIDGVAYRLPGVFLNNPYKGVVNGSLWTMPYEVRMYLLLIIFWVVSKVFLKRRVFAFELVCALCAGGSYISLIIFHILEIKEPPALRLFYMFFLGAAFFILRKRIVMDRRFFWGAIIANFIAFEISRELFLMSYFGSVAYIVLYIAYVPSGFVRLYNKAGDYSYGVYIYAFPVQQSIVALIPDISIFSMICSSLTVTLLFSALSWHFLESHALKLKNVYRKNPLILPTSS